MKKERKWREKRETEKDREDIFKCNNLSKKCAKWREGKRVSEIKKISLKLYNF